MFNRFRHVAERFPHRRRWLIAFVIWMGILSDNPYIRLPYSQAFFPTDTYAAEQTVPSSCLRPQANGYGEYPIAVGILKFNEKADAFTLEAGPLTVARLEVRPLTDFYVMLSRFNNRPVEFLLQEAAVNKGRGVLADFQGKIEKSNEFNFEGMISFYFGKDAVLGISGCMAQFVIEQFDAHNTRIVIRAAKMAGTSE